MVRRIPPEAYGRDYFLNPCLDGYQEYLEGTLSAVKAKRLDMLSLQEGTSVLEVGYGRGELLLHCALKGATVAGVDYSPEAYAIALDTLRGFPDADVRLADCRRLPFDASSFDRVFSGDVIEHLCFEDAIEMLKEMYRVTRPGGFMLVHTSPNTVFTKCVYPIAKHILRRIDHASVEAIEEQLQVMNRVHIDEYNLITLRRSAAAAGLRQASVWIDKDLMRSGEQRHTRAFAKNRLVRLANALGKYAAVRFILGNDLYLKCLK